jgi:Protein of unknown function (DUF3606)
MADDPKKTFEDRKTINLSETYEVRYWSKALGVDAADLRKLVAEHGKSVANIRKALGK